METPRPALGRTPVKRCKIVAELRSRIVSGELVPGSRLPSHAALQQSFSTGSVTVQRALSRLADDGFIRADGPRGTFVSDHPPHLAHYGVVFPEDPDRPMHHYSQFWQTLDRMVAALPPREDRKFRCYYDALAGKKSRDYPKLIDDLDRHRVAGVIFVSTPTSDSPFMQAPDLPRAAIMNRPSLPGIPAVYPDYDAWIRLAIHRLAEQGRQRVALIGLDQLDSASQSYLVEEARRHDMTIKPYWLQFPTPWSYTSIHNCLQLLLANEKDRPDALLIYDDNLVTNATQALNELRVDVPDDVTVIAHANFPQPTKAHCPVERLGFDIRKLLDLCISLIDRQRHGEVVAEMSLQGARFEE